VSQTFLVRLTEEERDMLATSSEEDAERWMGMPGISEQLAAALARKLREAEEGRTGE